MKKLKIWYVSKYAESPVLENPTRQFLLSKVFARQGAEVTLVFSRSNGSRLPGFWGLKRVEHVNDVRCVMLNGPIISTGFNMLRIFSWILFELNFRLFAITEKKNERPDVIIASSLSLLTFVTAAILKKKFKCKLILEIRDIWPETVIASGKLSERNIFIRILKRVELFGYKRADGFVSTLPRFDYYLRTETDSDFKFEFVPQGFDNDGADISSTESFRDEFLPGFFNVCYAGMIGEVNCVDEIISCAKLLKDSKIRFIIIGDGPLKKKLQNDSTGLDNIVFPGFVPKNELISILSNADLLLNLWHDYDIYKYGVSPNKWLDYMLSGRPMLISFSGYRGFITDAECAFFIEPGNPQLLAETILDLSGKSAEQLKQMGERGRNYAMMNLNYDILGKKFLDFVCEIVQR